MCCVGVCVCGLCVSDVGDGMCACDGVCVGVGCVGGCLLYVMGCECV